MRAEGFVPHAAKVAAALSAAVTTTKLIGDHPHVAWARKSAGTYKPIPSYSSGEGVWGRGASLREAASPPEFPHITKNVCSCFTCVKGGNVVN